MATRTKTTPAPQAVTLPDVAGRVVKRATIKFKNTGSDLTNPLAVAPMLIEQYDEGYALVKYICTDVAHPVIREKRGGAFTGDLEREHELTIEVVTFVDADFAAEKIAEQKRRVEELTGKLQLDLSGDSDNADATED